MATMMPSGWREDHGGDVACPHRDCSCCESCAKRPEVVEVYGRHFWVPEPAERAALAEQIAGGSSRLYPAPANG